MHTECPHSIQLKNKQQKCPRSLIRTTVIEEQVIFAFLANCAKVDADEFLDLQRFSESELGGDNNLERNFLKLCVILEIVSKVSKGSLLWL